MIVDVRHPALVSHVPPGGRAVRTTLAMASTPVAIEPVPSSRVREVHVLASSHYPTTLSEHGGVLWQRIETRPAPGIVRSIRPHEWTQWLAGRMPERDPLSFQLPHLMAMTPLSMLDRKAERERPQMRPGGTRGVELDLAAQRRVDHDGRAEAAGNVARFLSAETLVTDDAVHLRYRPHGTLDVYDQRRRYVDGRHVIRLRDLPMHPAALAATAAGMDAPSGSPFQRDRAALIGFGEDDEDLRLLANWLPGEVALLLADVKRRFPDMPGRPFRFAGAQASMAALARRGDMGGIDAADVPAVLDEVTDAVVAALGGPNEAMGKVHRPVPERGTLYLERDWANAVRDLVATREARRAPELAEDAEALTALAT